jgi:uncharacterized protein (DUF983 family)
MGGADRPGRMRAILRQRCPICHEGRVWRSGITMNETCPACGIVFEREQGYWLGALYVAYALSVPVLSALTILIWLVFSTSDRPVDFGRSFLIAMAAFVPMSPIVFRYSKVVWMHLDQLIDPRGRSTGD